MRRRLPISSRQPPAAAIKPTTNQYSQADQGSPVWAGGTGVPFGCGAIWTDESGCPLGLAVACVSVAVLVIVPAEESTVTTIRSVAVAPSASEASRHVTVGLPSTMASATEPLLAVAET